MSSGLATICRTNKFTLFSEDPRNKHEKNPNCTLTQMSFLDFRTRARGNANLPPILSNKEQYYFQAPPPHELERSVLESVVRALVPQNLILRATREQAVHGLHFDHYATGLFQVVGQKRVSLVSRAQFDNVQYVPHGPQARRSKLDLMDYAGLAQEQQTKLQVIDLTLDPGDILLFPAQTGHQTKALNASYTISFWYVPALV